MAILQKTALVFTIVGAIVWGIYGLFDVNIVQQLFGNMKALEKIIYIIVGVCGLINIRQTINGNKHNRS